MFKYKKLVMLIAVCYLNVSTAAAPDMIQDSILMVGEPLGNTTKVIQSLLRHSCEDNNEELEKIMPDNLSDHERSSLKSKAYTLKDGTRIIDASGFPSIHMDLKDKVIDIHEVLTNTPIKGIIFVIDPFDDLTWKYRRDNGVLPTPIDIMQNFFVEDGVKTYAKNAIAILLVSEGKTAKQCSEKFNKLVEESFKGEFARNEILMELCIKNNFGCYVRPERMLAYTITSSGDTNKQYQKCKKMITGLQKIDAKAFKKNIEEVEIYNRPTVVMRVPTERMKEIFNRQDTGTGPFNIKGLYGRIAIIAIPILLVAGVYCANNYLKGDDCLCFFKDAENTEIEKEVFKKINASREKKRGSKWSGWYLFLLMLLFLIMIISSTGPFDKGRRRRIGGAAGARAFRLR